jgi:Family of unknown function (DUF6011)
MMSWRKVISIAPIPALAELRGMVMARSAKRMPKWKFRIAPDFVIQLQPKPTTDLKFDGVAIAMDGVEASAFDRLSFVGPAYVRLQFELAATAPDVPDQWQFKPRGARCRWHSEADVLNLRARLLRALATRFKQLTPALMLQPQCVLCSRSLTDPASMARMIGPECSGTASLDAPMFKLKRRRRRPRQMLLSDFGFFDKT